MKTSIPGRDLARGGATFVVLMLLASCGLVREEDGKAFVARDGGKGGDARPGDDSTAPDGSSEPDGADATDAGLPVLTCSDGPCVLPPSTCIDRLTLRWFSAGCGDAGTCELLPHDMQCPGAGLGGGECYEGGCLPTVLR